MLTPSYCGRKTGPTLQYPCHHEGQLYFAALSHYQSKKYRPVPSAGSLVLNWPRTSTHILASVGPRIRNYSPGSIIGLDVYLASGGNIGQSSPCLPSQQDPQTYTFSLCSTDHGLPLGFFVVTQVKLIDKDSCCIRTTNSDLAFA